MAQSEVIDIKRLESLSGKYEDILEPKIKGLYMKIVNYVSVSQLPLVHVNAVLDLVKQDLMKQLHEGYFKEE